MLLKTTADLKARFSGIDNDFNFDSLKSFIDDAENDILIPWIGQEIYDVISAAYNADPATIAGKQAELLPFLQKAVVHLALLLSADSASFRVSDSGFYVVSTDTNKPVSDKKMTDFKLGRRESGYKGLEQAIGFLERNIADDAFAAYAGSAAHEFHRAYFINDSVVFTGFYTKINNSAYAFSQLMSALDYSERTYIMPALGQDYFDGLKSRLLAGELTDPEKKLLPYINRALANYTIAKALPGLPVTFEGNNLIVHSQPAKGTFDVADDKSQASPGQLGMLVNDAFATGLAELRNLETYLVLKAAELPGYIVPEITDDVDINDPCNPTYYV